jgi:hypothetical protein
MVLADDQLTQCFFEIGSEILGIGVRSSSIVTKIDMFRSNFKYCPRRCAYLYRCIHNHPALPDGYGPMHLLWTLYFLVSYACERRLCIILKADRKTIRKYTWPTITALASLAPQHVSENSSETLRNYCPTDVLLDSLGEPSHRGQWKSGESICRRH